MFTKRSFDHFVEVLKDCETTLLPENRADLTQEKIDEMITKVVNARNSLVFKVSENESSTVVSGNEGDIRRAISHEEDFFNFRASDIMTKKYKSVESEMMAIEAKICIELMQ